jgi:hypothetical protein
MVEPLHELTPVSYLLLATIMAEFSCYCQSRVRISVHCLMQHIDLHPLKELMKLVRMLW